MHDAIRRLFALFSITRLNLILRSWHLLFLVFDVQVIGHVLLKLLNIILAIVWLVDKLIDLLIDIGWSDCLLFELPRDAMGWLHGGRILLVLQEFLLICTHAYRGSAHLVDREAMISLLTFQNFVLADDAEPGLVRIFEHQVEVGLELGELDLDFLRLNELKVDGELPTELGARGGKARSFPHKLNRVMHWTDRK